MRSFVLIQIVLLVVGIISQIECRAQESFNINLKGPSRPLNKGFLKCAGSSHAATSLRASYQNILQRTREELNLESVRFHGIFDDDMSVVLNGPQYSFVNPDFSYDYLVSIGMKPLVELSFMPEMIASDPTKTIFHYKGGISPPKIISNWTNLVTTFARHLIDRYGLEEVSQWYFEVFNEPNCGFWAGSQAQYFDFYKATALAVKAASPLLKVVTCQCQWIPEFIRWTSQNNAPVDFISSHLYPTDPNVLQNKSTGWADVINLAAKQAGPYPFLVSEYNAGLYGNNPPILDLSYAAAFVARQIPYLTADNLVLWSYWTFSDIFEEEGQQPQPFGGFFGMQNINGIRKPVYRAFQLLNEHAGSQVIHDGSSSSSSSTLDVWTTLENVGSQLKVASFVTNFNIVGQKIDTETVVLNYTGVSSVPQTVSIYLIDDTNSNPRKTWEKLGSPTYPTPLQVAEMSAAAELVQQQVPTKSTSSSSFSISLQMKPQSLAVVLF